jgi:hypothetical protein
MSFPIVVSILRDFEYVYNIQSFVMSKLSRWSIVMTPSSGVKGSCFSSFRKLRKATITVVISVRPHGTTQFLLDGFSRNLIFEDFSGNIQV